MPGGRSCRWPCVVEPPVLRMGLGGAGNRAVRSLVSVSSGLQGRFAMQAVNDNVPPLSFLVARAAGTLLLAGAILSGLWSLVG